MLLQSSWDCCDLESILEPINLQPKHYKKELPRIQMLEMLSIVPHTFLTPLKKVYIHALKFMVNTESFPLDIFLHLFNCVRYLSANYLL
jgi:hypothetical protein